MIKSEARLKAEALRRKYGFTVPSYSDLTQIAEDEGFTLIEFDSVHNDKNVTVIIRELRLFDCISREKGFTFANSSYRLVFVNNALTEEEKTVVLAHELGHIVFGHLNTSAVFGQDVTDEHTANEFSHYLLTLHKGTEFAFFVRKHKKAAIAIVLALVLAVGGITVTKAVLTQQSYHGEYYVTATGTKYHKKDCVIIKDRNNLRRFTEEDYASGEYGPCALCLPD